jgi:two-component system chemotaxis response regulator CheB
MVSSLTQQGAEITLEALGAGAFDYLPKEDLQRALHALKLRQSLIEKIEAAARSPQARSKPVTLTPAIPNSASGLTEAFSVVPKIIVLGTSTGGPKALQELLPELPADLPVGMVAVQHMPPGFTGPFAKRLDGMSKMAIREARQGEAVEAGTVYIAPAGQHTTLFSNSGWKASICLSETPQQTLHKPSVDITMTSAAQLYGRYAMGIILTGMGSDGLQGMAAIREAGGITIGQDEATCAVYGMPRCCAEHGILQWIVPLGAIPNLILQAVHYKVSAGQTRVPVASI